MTKTLVLALVVVLGLGQQQKPEPGIDVLQRVHDRYEKTRFRTLTFLQKTTFPDGKVEWWYEAELIPGRARVDVAPIADGNMQIFRYDSAYIYKAGKLERSGAGLSATMWLLMDMYAVPVEETAAALRKRGFDLSKMHEREHNGRPTIVIGALAGDTTSAQFWLDKEHLYTVRLTVPRGGHRVTEVSKHVFMGGGWVEQEINVYLNNELTLLEEYTNTQVNVPLSPEIFEPPYRVPPWKETHPTLRPGQQLVYQNPNGEQVWVVDSLRTNATHAGMNNCLFVHFRTQTPRWQCARGDTLFAWREATGWSPSRPLRENMELRLPTRDGSVLYATTAWQVARIGEDSVRVLPTMVTTLDAGGKEVRRLRELYAPGLATAVEGTFEERDPASTTGWRTTLTFRLSRLTRE